MSKQYQNKLHPDIDGNSFSGRFTTISTVTTYNDVIVDDMFDQPVLAVGGDDASWPDVPPWQLPDECFEQQQQQQQQNQPEDAGETLLPPSPQEKEGDDAPKQKGKRKSEGEVEGSKAKKKATSKNSDDEGERLGR
ncbi:hypothetical protein N0V83_001953 [Neocucurbitaria cava]|uniref:Uncharacterized protein n=1 Tax=Neocucurbitaria cava TaxID=798079 RepID=A0A9W8YD71_9PLEO|nr:hypothetical protein N0V83_001953 [Neocucurbitaria cava]